MKLDSMISVISLLAAHAVMMPDIYIVCKIIKNLTLRSIHRS